MSKIAVVGDKDSILGFKSLGIPVFDVTDAEQAGITVNRLAKEKFAVIFITEEITATIFSTRTIITIIF